METLKVDVAIIGAGTAGLNARREVEKRGGRPLLIESGPYGTTCARVGCMPSKLLIAAAEWRTPSSPRRTFGVRAPGGLQVDGAAVMARVRAERDRFVGFVVGATEAIPAAQRLRGRARFVGADARSRSTVRSASRRGAMVVADRHASRRAAPVRWHRATGSW